MGLECLTAKCRGRVGGRKKRFWEGDEYACPKCSARYIIEVTDDYSDDAIASLAPDTRALATEKK